MGSASSKTATFSPSSSASSNSSFSAPETESNFQFPSTVPRAFSFPMPSIHHPPVKKGDTHHLVSLTSTTYGSLLLVGLDAASSDKQTLPHISVSGNNHNQNSSESRDSLSPDSVINTWELMNDLDDQPENSGTGKCNSVVNFESFSKPIVNRDVVINGSDSKFDESYEFVRIEEEDWIPKHKQPLWKHMSEESFLSDLDPNIISSYKKALLGKNSKSALISQTLEEQEKPRLLEDENKKKIVLYFTSLRGIRKTYEDCCCVRTILRGFRVTVEERDISMDSKYRKELQNAIGEAKPVCLPQVFIKGVRIGGIEEIKILNDGGELAEMLKEFPVCESSGACECCGDARFVLCTNCGGSTKVFEEQEDVFKRCIVCNENGLVRCNKCCL